MRRNASPPLAAVFQSLFFCSLGSFDMAINIPKLERITKGLGYICIFWAWLERGVDEMLEALIPLEEGDKSRAVVANINLRDKIRIIRALAFLQKFDDDWHKKLNALLDEIDNDLRVDRNRFIHDSWAKSGRMFERITRQTKFLKPQAFALELSTEQRTPVKMEEIWNLAIGILRAHIALEALTVERRDVQKFIDQEVDKRVVADIAAQTLEALLSASHAKSSQQNPNPSARDIRPKKRRSRQKSPP